MMIKLGTPKQGLAQLDCRITSKEMGSGSGLDKEAVQACAVETAMGPHPEIQNIQPINCHGQ